MKSDDDCDVAITIPAKPDLAMGLLGAGLLAGVAGLAVAASDEPGPSLTHNTIRLALGWYIVALLLMMRLTRGDWDGSTPRGSVARWCWTWALVSYLVHLAAAFHFYHHWSHAHAFEHTRDVSGVGEGIYVSYFFTSVWLADVLSWWQCPEWYAHRSAWIDRLLHAFMLFIVFNGTIIFEDGPIRWVTLVALVCVAIVWFTSAKARLTFA